MAKTNDTLLVSIDMSSGKDHTVLVVGRKLPNQSVTIVNAFQGKEAIELYNKLVTQNFKKKEEHMDGD